MANIFVKHNFSSVTAYVIITVFEHGNPAEITAKRITINQPHAERGDTITGLNPVMHTLKFYRSVNGTTLDSLLITASIDASLLNQLVITEYEYVVDRGQSDSTPGAAWADPEDGDTQINDERLAGGTTADVFISAAGYGKFRQDQINLLSGGGFEFAGDQSGRQFTEGETFFATRYNIVTQSIGGPVSTTSGYGLRTLVDADLTAGSIDLDDTFYGKIIPVLCSGTTVQVVFPALSLIPNTELIFNTFGGTQRYLKLQLFAGNTVAFEGQNRNVIWLSAQSMIHLKVQDNVLYVVDHKGYFIERGEFLYSNFREKAGCKLCDGVEANIIDYQPLIDVVPVEMKVTYAEWNLFNDVVVGDVTTRYYRNRGKFAIDLGAGKFKFPDIRDFHLKALKYMDGLTTDPTMLSQGAGGMQAQELIAHKHNLGNGFQKWGGSSGGQQGANDTANQADAATESTGGTRQRVDAIGQYVLVRI